MTRHQLGKWALGILSALLVAVLSWSGKEIWTFVRPLSVAAFNEHLAHDALHDQLDSVHFAKLDREVKALRCAGRKGCANGR